MIEEKNEVEFSILLLITILMNLLAIVIPSYFLYFYIKLKELHSFVCGHIIALSFSILLNNLIKLIPLGSDEKYKTFQYIQAFLLESLDKFILFILVGQAFILYIGDTYINFYSKFKRHIFFSSLFGCSGLSFLIGGLYLLFGVKRYGIYFYIDGKIAKKIIDNIIISALLICNTFLSMRAIWSIKNKTGIENEFINLMKKHFRRIILMFIVNSIILVESYFIVWEILPVSYIGIDLIYTITCILINLIYSINELIIKETKKIFIKKEFGLESKITKDISLNSEELANRSITFSDEE